MDVVPPISDGKLHPDAGTKTLIPSAHAGQGALPKHCTDLRLVFGHQRAAHVLLPSSERIFQKGFEKSFSCWVKLCNAVFFELIYYFEEVKANANGRNASSAEFNRVWKAQVRPLRPK